MQIRYIYIYTAENITPEYIYILKTLFAFFLRIEEIAAFVVDAQCSSACESSPFRHAFVSRFYITRHPYLMLCIVLI